MLCAEARVAEVPRDALPRMWPKVLPIIQAALDRGNGGYWAEDVLAELESGNWRMIFAAAPGKLVAVACCGVATYPRARHLWVHVAGGEGAADGVAIMMPALEQLAREGKCSKISFEGRRGWMRSGALPGWKHVADVAVVEVNDE